jgi:hypothetical protein
MFDLGYVNIKGVLGLQIYIKDLSNASHWNKNEFWK